jgi:hypothetical protein
MIVDLTEAQAAEIEADCLEALEFLAGDDAAISRASIIGAMQPKRAATRAVLEDVVLLPSVCRSIARNLAEWGSDMRQSRS